MRSNRPVQIDLFEDSRNDGGFSSWLSRARKAQYSLERVKNPYVGNKRKLLVDLASVLFEEGLSDVVDGGNVLDLFTGSGFVAYFFKSMGSCVWANDILGSSYLNATSLIIPQFGGGMSISKQFVEEILSPDGEPAGTRILDKYCPLRFSEAEAKRLDIIRGNMNNDRDFIERYFDTITTSIEPIWMMHYGKEPNPPTKEYDKYLPYKTAVVALTHYLMNCCFVGGRLNSGQIIAKYQHRIDHQRNGGYEMGFSVDDIPLFDIPVYGEKICKTTRSDAIDLLTSDNEYVKQALDSLDLVYIDPPYGGEQSDYSAMYDFIEDFLFYGAPKREIIKDTKRFSASKTYKESFIDLLASLPNQAIWVFSYNDSSWSDIDGIIDIIKMFRNKVSVSKINYKYHYRKDQSAGIEYVIIVKPK